MVFIALIWVLQIFNWVGHNRLDYDYGILPRNIGRLPQIFSDTSLQFGFPSIAPVGVGTIGQSTAAFLFYQNSTEFIDTLSWTRGKREKRWIHGSGSGASMARRSPCTSWTTWPFWRSIDGISIGISHGDTKSRRYCFLCESPCLCASVAR